MAADSIVTRREFLNRTSRWVPAAALAAGAVAAPPASSQSSASGSAGSSQDTLVLGMIGVGGRGGFLMQGLMQDKGTRFAALCDVNQRNLAAAVRAVAKSQGKEPTAVSDFRHLLDDASIDAVVIATPHHWHTPIALRALAAGKHVYLEKPASHVFREGRLLVEAARKAKRVFQHGTQMRSSEVTAAAAKVLASGILGEIKQAKAWGVEPRGQHPQPVADSKPPEYLDWDTWLGPAPQRVFNQNRLGRWNNFRDYGNGEIGGDGIHDIDLARRGLGETTHPVRITAHGSRIHVKGESDFPDNMLVAYQYANDKVLIYENRNFAPYGMHGWDNGNIFYGTNGYMVFSRRGHFQTYLGSKEEKGPGMNGGAGNQEHLQNFLSCVRSGRQPNADAETAHLSCALVHLGEIAYRTGRVLKFDPQTETFPEDDEANALLTKQYRSPWGVATT